MSDPDRPEMMPTIQREGESYVLEAAQFFDRRPQALFPFFADAENLTRITPPWLDFAIRSPRPIEMQRGTLIEYRLKLYGVPLRWRTEITAWEPPRRFIDSQLSGPYSCWIHEHILEPHDGGTLMRDRVTFRSRGPRFFTPMIHTLFVNRNVQRVFEYRRATLGKLFPVGDGVPAALPTA